MIHFESINTFRIEELNHTPKFTSDRIVYCHWKGNIQENSDITADS